MPIPRPPLSEHGHVICLSATYLLPDNGSGVVMRNLLGLFDSQSYSLGVIGGLNFGDRSKIENSGPDRTCLLSARTKKGRLNNYLFNLEMPLARRKLKKLVIEKQALCIVAVYPTFHFLQLARDVAKELQIPWLAYWHDTVFETLTETPFAERARRLQSQTFAESSSILVMSEGMANFYRDHYSQNTIALEHSYPEPIPAQLDEIAPVEIRSEALWGGSIYGINNKSVARVSQALAQNGIPFLITSRATSEQLQKQGIEGEHLRQTLFPSRKEYLEALQSRQILVLALNWPDETTMEEGELSTIFPTKTIEYLAAGRPIVVHCPEHYFLARFFRKHGCGMVVSQRSVEVLQNAIQSLRADDSNLEMRANALKTAQMFAPTRIGGLFALHVNAVSQVKWGEKAVI